MVPTASLGWAQGPNSSLLGTWLVPKQVFCTARLRWDTEDAAVTV